MSTAKYSWREGSRINLDPDIAGLEIERIYDKYGAITPDTIVSEAEDTASPLHQYFEWDDSAAAVEWRKQQGRLLLNNIQIKMVGESEPTVMNVSIKLDNGSRAYQKATVAVKSESQWDFVLRDTARYLDGARKRLEDLAAIETNTRRAQVLKAKDAVVAATAMVQELK